MKTMTVDIAGWVWVRFIIVNTWSPFQPAVVTFNTTGFSSVFDTQFKRIYSV